MIRHATVQNQAPTPCSSLPTLRNKCSLCKCINNPRIVRTPLVASQRPSQLPRPRRPHPLHQPGRTPPQHLLRRRHIHHLRLLLCRLRIQELAMHVVPQPIRDHRHVIGQVAHRCGDEEGEENKDYDIWVDGVSVVKRETLGRETWSGKERERDILKTAFSVEVNMYSEKVTSYWYFLICSQRMAEARGEREVAVTVASRGGGRLCSGMVEGWLV